MVKIGPTGEFPAGISDPDDEGELIFAVNWDASAGCVRIDFGTPVGWLAMPPDQATEFAKSIMVMVERGRV